jgi:hypothetical protein
VPGQEYDGQDVLELGETILHFQTAQPGHAHVEQYAAWTVGGRTLQEFVAGLVERDLIAASTQQAGNGGAESGVIVHHVNDRRCYGHAGRGSDSGRVKRNTAPPPVRFSAQIFPP